MASHARPKNTRVKLVYPAQQFAKTEIPRPDGSLGLLYLAGTLRDHGFEVSILDMCVGQDGDALEDTFFCRTEIDDAHIRVGISTDRLREELRGFRIVGVTSIFTPQTFNCFEVARTAKEVDSTILTIAGGGNARAFHKLFLDNGFDIVVFGEGEETMLEIALCHETHASYESIRGIAYKTRDGEIVVNAERPVLRDLDRLPFPAWDLLPLRQYWRIGEPHGGTFPKGSEVRYLSMQTSRGCPFRCTYCHISKEGDAATLRLKSHERVMAEIDRIQSLGAEYLFFEDDSLLAKRDRIKRIFRELKAKGLKIIDANGVNLAHFYTPGPNKQLVVDEELLDLMVEVGWVECAYPFESGCQRILNKYASHKWDLQRHNPVDLVRKSAQRGLTINGFFTIGYPDETYEELTQTFLLAQDLTAVGLTSVAFYIIVPYPGSVLYDMAAAGNNLPESLDLRNMKFALSTMVNTLIEPAVLEYSRRLAYQLINPKELVAYKSSKNAGAGTNSNPGRAQDAELRRIEAY
jgi:anaerobic magnesium-protoporphyrin IX monomethyl ester cyclase